MHPYLGFDVMAKSIAVHIIRVSLLFKPGPIFSSLSSFGAEFYAGVPSRKYIAIVYRIIEDIAKHCTDGCIYRGLASLQPMLRDLLLLVCCGVDQEITVRELTRALNDADMFLSPLELNPKFGITRRDTAIMLHSYNNEVA